MNYRFYKHIFEFENYFNILENKDIFTFCKFRTINAKLNMEDEMSRYISITKETMQTCIRYGRQLGSFSSK
jgi:hypothetical protein